MENITPITFNLTKLLSSLKLKTETQIEFELLLDNSSLGFRIGGIVYFFDYDKLQAVLDHNDFNNYYKEETEDEIIELLSRHIVNQLSASMGQKVYPEIKTLPSDLNQH